MLSKQNFNRGLETFVTGKHLRLVSLIYKKGYMRLYEVTRDKGVLGTGWIIWKTISD